MLRYRSIFASISTHFSHISPFPYRAAASELRTSEWIVSSVFCGSVVSFRAPRHSSMLCASPSCLPGAFLWFKAAGVGGGGRFLSLFLKATSLIGEPIFERGFVFDPSSRHR